MQWSLSRVVSGRDHVYNRKFSVCGALVSVFRAQLTWKSQTRSLAAVAARGSRRLRLPRTPVWGPRLVSSYTTSSRRSQNVFHSQTEDPASAAILNSLKTAPQTPQTLTEKIVQRYSVGLAPGKKVRPGDYVTLSPHHCMTHDNSWPVALKFMSIGASEIHDNKQVVMVSSTSPGP